MSRPVDPQRRCTPVAEWPDRDRAAWALAQEPDDPLEPAAGYALRWRPSTRGMIESGYGRWLGWLDRLGLLDPASPAGDRISQERVAEYRDMLRATGGADNTVAGRLQQLCNALRAIEPGGDWAWIHRASSRLYAKAKLVRDPALRIQPAADVIALGNDLMHAAEHDRFRTPCDRATLFRDGLMIAFLVQRPFRSANLTEMTLGQHLEQRGGRWRLFFDGSATKGGEVINCAWPDSLEEALERYLEVHRGVLLSGAAKPKRPTQALWISRQGGAMGAHAIAFQIKHRTGEAFGTPINPHAFRHIAATTIATANPEGVSDIQGVLGHVSMHNSYKHYNRAKMVAAGDTYHATLADLRKRK